MLELRRPTAADRDTLVGWLPDEEALYLFAGPSLRWPLTTGQLADMERFPGLTAWTVADAGTAVGRFDLTLRDRAAHLGRVIVDPDRRGEGLSHALLRLAIARARLLDAAELTLNVMAGNEPARRAYVRAGFHALPSDEIVRMSLSLLP